MEQTPAPAQNTFSASSARRVSTLELMRDYISLYYSNKGLKDAFLQNSIFLPLLDSYTKIP